MEKLIIKGMLYNKTFLKLIIIKKLDSDIFDCPDNRILYDRILTNWNEHRSIISRHELVNYEDDTLSKLLVDINNIDFDVIQRKTELINKSSKYIKQQLLKDNTIKVVDIIDKDHDATDRINKYNDLLSFTLSGGYNFSDITTAYEIGIKDIPKPYFIIDKLLPAGLVLLAGEPKCGTSWLVLNLCLVTTNGRKALGYFDINKNTDALYLALEDDEIGMNDRLESCMRGASILSLILCPRVKKCGNVPTYT